MAKKSTGYTEGIWKGLPQWRCKFCAFDTLSEPAMLEHIAKQHGPAPKPPEPVIIPVIDRFGNEVKDG